mmetsp:Transcript_86493/g.175863  ORF Transcript_86493/g.175863 Transcript_86493/m.175863 type:complete len:213 (+) Transcript_86493:1254-1892(+)
MHVWIQHAGHLLLLDSRHSALGEQYEALHILLPTQAVDGGAPGVPARRTNHSQPLRVPPQEVLIEVAQCLQGNILKGEGRTVEQLHDMDVVHLYRRHDLRVRESLVAFQHELSQIRRWHLIVTTVERSDLECQLMKRQRPPTLVVHGYVWDLVRDHEPAIGCEALENSLLKSQTRCASSGAPIPDPLGHRHHPGDWVAGSPQGSPKFLRQVA